MSSTHSWSITVLIAVIVGSVGFFGGVTYQKTRMPVGFGGSGQFRQAGTGAAGGAMRGANRGNGPMGGIGMGATGEVVTVEDGTMTLKLRDGASKLVLMATSTQIGKMTSGTVADLKPGTTVLIIGPANADGSLTANSIQIRPASTTGMERQP